MLQRDKENAKMTSQGRREAHDVHRHAASGHTRSSVLCMLAAVLLAGAQGAHAQGTGSYVPVPQGAAGSSKKVAIIVGVCVVAGFVLVIAAVYTWRVWNARKAATRPQTAAVQMAQTSTTPRTTTNRTLPTAAARPSRRPARQASTMSVPVYTKDALDEEMVLNKAEDDVEPPTHVADDSGVDLTSDIQQAELPARLSRSYHRQNNASAITLLDIPDPAPELRFERWDTVQSTDGFSRTSLENPQQRLLAAASNNASSIALDEIPLDEAMPPLSLSTSASPSMSTHSSARRPSSSSFFASPAYVNRSRSQSIDAYRSLPATQESEEVEESSSSRSRRPSSSAFRFPFHKRHSTSQGLPLPATSTSAHLAAARKDALRNRDISAPLSDTLVRTSTSYVFPRSGLNPLQAAWLGSKDSIGRLAVYLDTSPPKFAFDEEAAILEDAEEDLASSRPQSQSQQAGPLLPIAEGSVSLQPAAAQSPRALRIDTTLTQLEEESAQLSALVARTASVTSRHSLPPHLVPLPMSVPSSPAQGLFASGSMPAFASPSSTEWPVHRSVSLVRGPRSSLDASLGPPRSPQSRDRRRVQSEMVPLGEGGLRASTSLPAGPFASAAQTSPVLYDRLARPTQTLRRGESTTSTSTFLSAEEELEEDEGDKQDVQKDEEGRLGSSHRYQSLSQQTMSSFATAASSSTLVLTSA